MITAYAIGDRWAGLFPSYSCHLYNMASCAISTNNPEAGGNDGTFNAGL